MAQAGANPRKVALVRIALCNGSNNCCELGSPWCHLRSQLCCALQSCTRAPDKALASPSVGSAACPGLVAGAAACGQQRRDQ